MNKTMEEWRIELNDLFSKSANEAAKMMVDMQSEIIIAFCAKYHLQPNECVLFYQGNKFWVDKKENEHNWINVEDRLPEEYKRVLVYRGNYEGGDKDEIIHVGFYRCKNGFCGSQYGHLDDDLYPHTLVTHWMSLPEPPV